MANSITTLDTLLNGLDIPGFGGVEKAASVAESTPQVDGVAKALEDHLNKQANEETPEMSAQKGRNIAAGVLALVKKAMDAEVAAEAGPNNVIAETDAMAASSTAGQQAIPKDGTITQTLQAMLQTGLASGAVGPDQLYLNSIAAGQDEGNSPIGLASSDGRDINAIPAGGSMSEQVEKTAALVHLVDNGIDFDTAVNLIKQAEYQIYAEEDQQIKVAAVNELMSRGYDIEDAVALVKQADRAGPTPVLNPKAGTNAKQTKFRQDSIARLVAENKARENYPELGLKGGNYGKGKALADRAEADAMLAAKRRGDAAAGSAANSLTSNFEWHPRKAYNNARLEAALAGNTMDKVKAFGRHLGPQAALGLGAAGLVGGGIYAATHDKKASAIEGLVLAGYSVEQALQLLEG